MHERLRLRRSRKTLCCFAFAGPCAASSGGQPSPHVSSLRLPLRAGPLPWSVFLLAATVACESSPVPERDDDFRIVNGDLDIGDEAIAYLGVLEDPTGSVRSECSGTLIGDRWVLTAAHCVDEAILGFAPGAILVYFGTTVVSESDPYRVLISDAETFVMHERWNPDAPENGYDAALIRLSDSVPITPIPMHRQAVADRDLGRVLRLVGWGITENGAYDSGIKRYAPSQLFDYDDVIVRIGGEETNVCSGDSGGPALLVAERGFELLAITSFVDPLCVEYGFGTRVDRIANWVDTNIAAQTAYAGSFGDTCSTSSDCESEVCVADDAGAFCSLTCVTSTQCPEGWTCYRTNDETINVCAVTASAMPGDSGVTSTPAPTDPSPSDSSGGATEGALDDDDDDDDTRRRGREVRCAVDPGANGHQGWWLVGLLTLLRRRRRSLRALASRSCRR